MRFVKEIPANVAVFPWTYSEYPDLLQKHHGNVRQLLGFDSLPPDRDNKGGAHDHYLLEDTTWMYHRDSSVVVPLFGSQNAKFKQLQQHGTLQMGLSSFKQRLLNPGTTSKCGWWSGKEPASVASLPDGSSLFNLPSDTAAPATAPQLPDFAAGWREAQQEAVEVARAVGASSSTTRSCQVSFLSPKPSLARYPRCTRLPRAIPPSRCKTGSDRLCDRVSCTQEGGVAVERVEGASSSTPGSHEVSF